MTGRASALVLTLFGLATAPAETQAHDPSEDSAWSVTRRMDPILETMNITAMLKEAGVESSPSGYAKYLVLRCRRQHLDVFVSWGRYGVLGSGLLDHRVPKVTARFDTGVHQTGSWPRSTDGAASFVPRPHHFLRLLWQHDRLAVWTHSDRGDPLTAVFELAGARPIVQDVLDACEQCCEKCPANAR